ncbi:MAG: C2H2-type zinc finger protein [Nitrospira sp.]
MAKITPKRYECDYCEKPFKTPQAVRGHLRHCTYRRLRQQTATQSEAEPATPTITDRESRRPGPDSQDMKLLLLDTQEEFTRLKSDAGDHTFWAEFMFRTDRTHAEGRTTHEEWVRIYQDLGDIQRDLDQMIGPLRLDRSILFNTYHRMLAVQSAWLEYRARDFTRGGVVTPEGEDVLRVEQARFAALMLNIKRMLVAAR